MTTKADKIAQIEKVIHNLEENLVNAKTENGGREYAAMLDFQVKRLQKLTAKGPCKDWRKI